MTMRSNIFRLVQLRYRTTHHITRKRHRVHSGHMQAHSSSSRWKSMEIMHITWSSSAIVSHFLQSFEHTPIYAIRWNEMPLHGNHKQCSTSAIISHISWVPQSLEHTPIYVQYTARKLCNSEKYRNSGYWRSITLLLKYFLRWRW